MVRFEIARSVRPGYFILRATADDGAVVSTDGMATRYRSQTAASNAALAMGWIPSNLPR